MHLYGEFGFYRYQYRGINTDTRTIKKGELFIALKGENFDGHAYAGKAAESGAAGILASRKVDVEGIPVIYVEDTLKGYQDIAHAYRMKFPSLKVVAITGSNGKTSTKDMVATVLASRYNVVKTQANFNNEIGLPRTLLGIQPDTDIAVVEMGMRGLGQIKAMCAIARPDVAVISNVGSTHVGELGSLDNIAKAKSEILEDLPSDGFAVLNGDLPEADDVRAENVEITADGSRFICKTADGSAEFFIPQIGEHNVMNALSAIAVGRHFGVQLNNIKTALQGTVLTGSRQELLHFGSYTVINDAYNASPASMEAAFATLARLKQSAQSPCRTIAVVADMLELGDTAAEAHQSVGRMAAKAKTDILLGYGEETKATVDAAAAEGVPAFHFADRQGAAKKLTEILKPGDIVLLKGSHSMQVSGIIDLVFKK